MLLICCAGDNLCTQWRRAHRVKNRKTDGCWTVGDLYDTLFGCWLCMISQSKSDPLGDDVMWNRHLYFYCNLYFCFLWGWGLVVDLLDQPHVDRKFWPQRQSIYAYIKHVVCYVCWAWRMCWCSVLFLLLLTLLSSSFCSLPAFFSHDKWLFPQSPLID